MGDYTRLLAESCQQRGHPAQVIALHDRQLAGASTLQGGSVKVRRYSTATPWAERVRLARGHLDAFAPDWISLQFVPYGFHRKGLALGLAGRLRALMEARSVHLMLHELWIGAEADASLKHRLIGTLQRWVLSELIRQLAPKQIHTSNAVYQMLLQARGIPNGILPMFGAFPPSSQPSGTFINALRQAGVVMDPVHRPQYWIFALFGALHPVWPPEPLFGHLQRAAHHNKKRVLIAGIGRLGPGQPLWNTLQTHYGHSFEFCHLGEQPPASISAFLSGADFGIATTPLALIGKSATVAAMVEHGLPVIVNRNEVQFPHCPAPDAHESLLIPMTDALPQVLPRLRHGPLHRRLPAVTDQFIADLNEIHSHRSNLRGAAELANATLPI